MSGNGKVPTTHARMRLEAVLRARPGKPLEHGETLLFHHALRCICQRCKRLINWESDDSVLISECCGMEYRLLPRTVVVEVKDVSSRPILPQMKGSDYSDPATDLSHLIRGEAGELPSTKVSPLTANHRSLREGNEDKQELEQSAVVTGARMSRVTDRSEPRKVKLKLSFREARKAQ